MTNSLDMGRIPYPKQSDWLYRRVEVCFAMNPTETFKGSIVRVDAEEPGRMIICLDGGRYVLSTECSYRFLPSPGPVGQDFSAAELRMISAMMRAEKKLPEGLFGVAIVQDLACYIARELDSMAIEDADLLIGIGAWVARQANNETTAELEAMMAFRKAGFREPPENSDG